MKKLLVKALPLLLVLSFSVPVLAGQFSVTPVRIYMVPKDKAVAVTITNKSNEELLMQADLYLWQQKPDGQEDLTFTEEMFLSPPIIKLAPMARQVVRLARLKTPKSTEQLFYRMILREVPEAKPETEGSEVQIALAFSIPVFITPPRVTARLNCTVEKVAADTVKALCENTGTAYAYPVALLLTSNTGVELASRNSGGYILPGIKRSFDIKRDGATIPDGNAKLVLTLVDGGKQTFEVSLAK